MKLNLHLDKYQSEFANALAEAAKENLVARIWARDHRVWQPTPDEISNRLGWLDIAERMQPELPTLQAFSEEIKAAGFRHVLLLGMGGSSLAPELFSRMLKPAPGYPDLQVLDSTDPGAVQAAADEFDPRHTLYIVATKSGGTVETLSFFKYFYNLAKDKLGADRVGEHFIAITDPGSKLVDLAGEFRFRRTFENDPDIGGRYSALSYFGLLPAALLGIDLEAVLAGALSAAEACKQDDPAKNPGLRLGLALSSLAQAGRDKLTFIAPEELASFADWAEQLIAESTGKEGTAILPVAHEPPGRPAVYGEDRVFVALSLAGQAAIETDALQAAGHPLIQLDWQDVVDVGAQFFLWEFATAVAGHGLGIHPFNQPNVEAAKKQAGALVESYLQDGELPPTTSTQPSSEALQDFLAQADTGDYIALQAYIHPMQSTSAALHQLQATLRDKYKLATTTGFGPRFLHSTGQLHKGDAGNGLFVQLVTPPPENDLAIPLAADSDESEISFGVLKYAQAAGDAQALREAGRRVLTFELQDDAAETIQHLAESIDG